jgi:hypothetical protein
MTRLGSLQLLLPLARDALQPLAPLLQLPSLRSIHIGSCQPSGGLLMQQLAAAGAVQHLSIQVRGWRYWQLCCKTAFALGVMAGLQCLYCVWPSHLA